MGAPRKGDCFAPESPRKRGFEPRKRTKGRGSPLEVILGYDFLRDHVVEVDYSKHHLRIFNAFADVLARGLSMPLHLVGNRAHVKSELTLQGKSYSLKTLVLDPPQQALV